VCLLVLEYNYLTIYITVFVTRREGLKMTLEVTKTVLNKIILNVWIENGPVL
jgi:hypothetical protein